MNEYTLNASINEQTQKIKEDAWREFQNEVKASLLRIAKLQESLDAEKKSLMAMQFVEPKVTI